MSGEWGIPAGDNLRGLLPQILAVLIDRAGGTITLSDRDLKRIAYMKPGLQFSVSRDLQEDTHVRYQESAATSGELDE